MKEISISILTAFDGKIHTCMSSILVAS